MSRLLCRHMFSAVESAAAVTCRRPAAASTSAAGGGGQAHRIRGGAARVELAVQVARQLQPAALGGGDPQVGAASVKHDHELLLWCTQSDLSIVLHVSRATGALLL